MSDEKFHLRLLCDRDKKGTVHQMEAQVSDAYVPQLKSLLNEMFEIELLRGRVVKENGETTFYFESTNEDMVEIFRKIVLETGMFSKHKRTDN